MATERGFWVRFFFCYVYCCVFVVCVFGSASFVCCLLVGSIDCCNRSAYVVDSACFPWSEKPSTARPPSCCLLIRSSRRSCASPVVWGGWGRPSSSWSHASGWCREYRVYIVYWRPIATALLPLTHFAKYCEPVSVVELGLMARGVYSCGLPWALGTD